MFPKNFFVYQLNQEKSCREAQPLNHGTSFPSWKDMYHCIYQILSNIKSFLMPIQMLKPNVSMPFRTSTQKNTRNKRSQDPKCLPNISIYALLSLNKL